MPFSPHDQHLHSRQHSRHPSTGEGIFQAFQTAGSIGAPQGNLLHATTGTTTAGTDTLNPESGNTPGAMRPMGGASSGSGAGGQEMHMQQSQHMYQAGDQYGGGGAADGGRGMHGSSAGVGGPNITLQQAPQQHHSRHQYGSSQGTPVSVSSSTGVPGSLTPGGSGGLGVRPTIPSQYSSSSSGHPVPVIHTNAQQYTLPTRSSTLGGVAADGQVPTPPTLSSSHSYSRSSPAGLDQKYIPFSTNAAPTSSGNINAPNTPDASRSGSTQQLSSHLTSTPIQRPSQQSGAQFMSPTTPQGGSASRSPLGLEDIRTRADSNLEGEGGASSSLFRDLLDRQPGNSCYLAPWAVSAFDWCKWPVQSGGTSSAGKLAVGSYLEDPHNFIQILDTHMTPQEVTTPGQPAYGLEYSKVAEATCSYPVTRILWEPPSSQKQSTDLLATSGDHLRLWSLPSSTTSPASNTITRSSAVNMREQPTQKLTPLALLSNSKSPEHTAPLTSLDWNTLSPKLIITSSIDTTCTIWDIPTLTAKTQLIAHDREVFDVRFCAQSVDVFVSCGADGSVRMFDLRSLEHSTIIYEPAEKADKEKGSPGRMSPTKSGNSGANFAPPLLRLAASPHDSHLLATIAQDSPLIRILDVRQPGQALLELRGHAAPVNCVEWSPHRRGTLASGADDSLVLVWDLLNSSNGAALNGAGADPATDSLTRTSTSTSLSGNDVKPNSGIGVGAGGASQTGGAGLGSAAGSGGTGAGAGGSGSAKGPAMSWRCDYEVGNLSWAPPSGLTGSGGDWVGVAGGRGVWGVKL